jgi:tRNA(fMet)-specific endonuclease VapC
MIILDTDHVTVLKYPNHPRAQQLAEKLDAISDEDSVAVSIISIEEQMRGWLAAVAKERQASRQVMAYSELQRLFEYFQFFEIVAFDEMTAQRFESLRAAKIRVGTMDLKIAATALVRSALLLTANTRDFERVPGLRVQNWLD